MSVTQRAVRYLVLLALAMLVGIVASILVPLPVLSSIVSVGAAIGTMEVGRVCMNVL